MLALLCCFSIISAFSQTADFSSTVTSGCAPVSINFTDISSGGTVISRSWNLGNGTIANTAETVGINYTIPNTYTITLSVTFAGGITRTVSKQITIHPKPVADFTALPLQGCSPMAVQFTDHSTTATGTITSWQWNVGGASPTTQNPLHNYNTPGNYTVSLFVENNWGCRSDAETKTHYVQVLSPPNTSFSIADNSNCDLPFTPAFSNTTSGSGTIAYSWNFGDGSGPKTGENPGHTYTTAGVYIVSLTASNGINCERAATTQTVYVGRPATPVLIAPSNICVNTNTTYSVNGIPAGWLDRIEWNFGTGTRTTNSSSVNYSYTAAGSQTITATVYYRSGCQDVFSSNVVISPTPSVSVQANPTISCRVPFTSGFTATASPANPNYIYDWNFGDGQTAQGTGLASPSHTYNTAGNFQVTVRVTDPANPNTVCNNNSAQTNVRIVIPDIEIYRILPQNPCNPPSTVRFDTRWRNLITSSNNVQYSWDFGDGSPVETVTASGVNANMQHVYNRTGVFVVTLTATTADGCVSTTQETVTVTQDCPPPGPISGGGFGDNGGDCDNFLSYRFNGHYVEGTIIVGWDFGDGNTAGAFNNVSHVYAAPGSYTVTVTREVTFTGAIIQNSRIITVADDPLVFSISGNPLAVCPTVPITFGPVGLDPERVAVYNWDFGDGSPILSIPNPELPIPLTGETIYAYENDGNFNVSLTVTDRRGCNAEAVNTVAVIISGPEADFTADILSSCDSSFEVTFTPETIPIDPSAPITQWRWDFGDGTTPLVINTGDPVTHRFANTHFYRAFNITLTVTDANGCRSGVRLKEAYVKAYYPQALFSAASPLRCNDNMVQFYNNSQAQGEPAAPAVKYTWDYGDGSPAFSTNAGTNSHEYPGNGQYTVTLQVMDENGCVDTAMQENYIRIVHPTADFEPGSSIEECAPISLGFTNRSETYGQPATYSWDFGYTGNISALEEPTPVIYPIPNDYAVQLVVNSMGCTDTIVKIINVKGPRGVLHSDVFAGCRPLIVNMSVTGSNISTYAWDFDDGTAVIPSASANTTDHTYTFAGSYAPNVILTSPEGCAFTLRPPERITVDSLQVSMSLSDTLFCEQGIVQFSGSATIPTFSALTRQSWLFGDGSGFEGSTPPEHLYTAPGVYPVTLITETSYGCIDTATARVHINAPPQIDFDAPAEVCVGTTVPFEAIIQSQDEIQRMQWLVNDLPVFTENIYEHLFQDVGSYHITARVETLGGCNREVGYPLQVQPLPVPNAQPVNGAVCEGDTINLSAEDGVSYQWFSSEATLIGGNTANPTAAPDNTSDYRVVVTNSFGCEASEIITVSVDHKIGLTHSENTVVCAGNPVQLNASGNTQQFVWTPADGLSQSNIANPIARPDQTTTYQVTAVSHNSCPSETGHILVVVGYYPTVAIGPDLVLEGGTIHQFHPATSTDVQQYHWLPARGLSCTDCANPSFIADDNTRYTLAVTNEYNCTTTDTVNVQVICKKDAIYIPNAFTPNGDGLNDYFYIPGFGVEQVKSFTVYSRFGDVVYQQKNVVPGNKEYGWDGKVRGKTVETTTVFVYTAEVVCNGITLPLKGTVTLIR